MAEANPSERGHDLAIINEFIKMPVISDDDVNEDRIDGQFSQTAQPIPTIASNNVQPSFGNTAAGDLTQNSREKAQMTLFDAGTIIHNKYTTNISHPVPVIADYSETSRPVQRGNVKHDAAARKAHLSHLRKRKHHRKSSLHKFRSSRTNVSDKARKKSSKRQQHDKDPSNANGRAASILPTNIDHVAPPLTYKPPPNSEFAADFSAHFPTTSNLQTQKASQNSASNLIKLANISQNPQITKIIHETEHLNHKVEVVSKKNQKLALERERLLTTIQNTSAMLHSTVSALGTEAKERNRSVKSSMLQLESIKQTRRRLKSSSTDDSADSDSLERSTRFTIKEFDNLLTALQTKQPTKPTKKQSLKKSAKKKLKNSGNPDPVTTDSNKPSQYDIIVQWLNNKVHMSDEASPDGSANESASSSSSATSSAASLSQQLSAILPQPPTLSEVSKSDDDSSEKNTARMNNFLENIKKSFVSSKEKLENTRLAKNINNNEEDDSAKSPPTLPFASSIQRRFIDQHKFHNQQSAPNMSTNHQTITKNMSPMIELPGTAVDAYKSDVLINVTAEDTHQQLNKNMESVKEYSRQSVSHQPRNLYLPHKNNEFNEQLSVTPTFEFHNSSKEYLPRENNESVELQSVAPAGQFDEQSNRYILDKNDYSNEPQFVVPTYKFQSTHKNNELNKQPSVEITNLTDINDESVPLTTKFLSSKRHLSPINDELVSSPSSSVAPTFEIPPYEVDSPPKNEQSNFSVAPTFEIPPYEVVSPPKNKQSNFNSPQSNARTYEIPTTSDHYFQHSPQHLEISISECDKIKLPAPLDLSLRSEFQKFDDRVYLPAPMNIINEQSEYDVEMNPTKSPPKIENCESVKSPMNDNDTFNLSSKLDVDEQSQTRFDLDQTANVETIRCDNEQNQGTETTLSNVERGIVRYSPPAENNNPKIAIENFAASDIYGEYANDYERKDILGHTEDQEEDCNASQTVSMADEDKVRAAAAAEVVAPTDDKKEFLQNWLDDLKTRTRQYHESQCGGSIYNVDDSYKGKLAPSKRNTNNEDEHEEFITLCKTMIERMDSMISKPTRDDIDDNKISYPRRRELIGGGPFTYQQRYNILKKPKRGYRNSSRNRSTKLSRPPADKYETGCSSSSDETPSSDKDEVDDKNRNGGFRTFQKCLANLEQMNMRRTNNALTQTLIIKALRKLMAKQRTKMSATANDRDRKAGSLCAAAMTVIATDADEDTDDECESLDNSPPRKAKAKIKMKHVKKYAENNRRHHRRNVDNVSKGTVGNGVDEQITALTHLDNLESHRRGHRYIDKGGGLNEDDRLETGNDKLTTSMNMYNNVNKVSESIIYQDLGDRFGVFNSKNAVGLVNERAQK